ncbi:MAG: hypothetical protein ACM3PY_04485 [Omnitrophica WOR_2 bacterium]
MENAESDRLPKPKSQPFAVTTAWRLFLLVALVWLGMGIRKQKKLYFYLAVIYLAINLILTITDDFGLADLLYIVLVACLLVFLLLSWPYYLSK